MSSITKSNNSVNSLTHTTDNPIVLKAVQEMQTRREVVVHTMNALMQKGIHYGIIPGTKQFSLLKPGMDMLCSTLRFVAHYSFDIKELAHEHREVTAHVKMTSRASSDEIIGTGIGVCTTMEKKYRYRNNWEGKVKTQVENPDLADQYNTVAKMAAKRALSMAIQTATGCTDIFASDPSDIERVDPSTGEILDDNELAFAKPVSGK